MNRIERIAALYPEIMRSMGRIRDLVHDGMDLTYNQYKTLLTVAAHERCTLNMLAGELKVATSSASEMVEKLVNVGLLSRITDAANRRQVNIALTPQGQQLIAELQGGIVANYRAILARLPEGEQERLVQALETLADVFGKLDGKEGDRT